MDESPRFTVRAHRASQGEPLSEDVRESIHKCIEDWNGCPIEAINALKEAFGCPGLSISYKGNFDLQDRNFDVFASRNARRWFYYSGIHGYFLETVGTPRPPTAMEPPSFIAWQTWDILDYMGKSHMFTQHVLQAILNPPLHDDVRASIGRCIENWDKCPIEDWVRCPIEDWYQCSQEDVDALKAAFGCPGLEMSYNGTYDLQGVDFAVFASSDARRWFYYAVAHGCFFESDGGL